MFIIFLLSLNLWLAQGGDGSLRVKTDVSEVEVLLDGVSVGKTPLLLDPVASGAHRLTLIKPGYEDNEQQVQVRPGAMAKVFALMKPLPAPPLQFPQRFYAIHQHAAGACSGVLVVTAEAVDYRSHDGKEVFHIPMQEVKSLSRSMGTAWWTNSPLRTPGDRAGCRLEVPGRSYGFFAYEEDPALAGSPAEGRVKVQDTTAKTKELFELLYRMWSERLDQKLHPKGDPKAN